MSLGSRPLGAYLPLFCVICQGYFSVAFSGLVCVLNFNAECTIQTGAVKSVYKMNVVENTFSLKIRRLVIPFTKKNIRLI